MAGTAAAGLAALFLLTASLMLAPESAPLPPVPGRQAETARVTPTPPERPATSAAEETARLRPGVRPGVLCRDTRLEGAAIPAVADPESGCRIPRPVRLSAVAGVRLDPPATLDCEAARALAGWAAGPLQTAAEDRLGARVRSLRVFASYACRGRNNRTGAKLSEHAFGRAIDIGAFTLTDGRKIAVLSGWDTGDEGAFLAAIRNAACGPFSTVLGPGSDEYHADHLHLDAAERREPYCQ